jgi:alpha-ketoglutarate-dependent sulfate ester dioxygenase
MSAAVIDRVSAGAGASSLEITPVTPVIGAEVRGLDLREALDEATIAELRRKLLAHKVLFFRDQPISDQDQIRLSRYFGKITPAHPVTNGLAAQPEIMENVKTRQRARQSELDEIQKQELRAHSRPRRGRGWHTDITFVANPTSITFLRGIEVPAFGGDTSWINLEALYESLSPLIRELADKLTAVHGRDDARGGFTPPPRFDGHSTGPYLAEHPLVRVHPETGRKGLFLSPGFIRYIVGVNEGESSALIDYLAEELAGRIDLQVRFHWTPNALAVWDNRATSHWGPVDADRFEDERIVRRTTIDPDYTVGPTGFRSRQILGESFYTLD